MHGREDAAFARHVVRLRWHRPKGRTAHHELLMTEAQQVSQIRVAAGKLLDGHRRRSIEPVAQLGS